MTGPIERVVVPLDAASENHTAIDTAVRLAVRVNAPLHGLFVEDEELLHLAGLPFARQVTLGAGTERFTTETIELHLRAAAERTRQELFAVATQHRVEHTFDIVRGTSRSALSGASERDLVVAGALSRPIAGHFRVEYRWWSSAETAPGPFLLARNNWASAGSVVVLLRDRGAKSARLLEAAAQIAVARESVLTVMCPPDAAGAEACEKWVSERLSQYPVRIEFEAAPAEPAVLQQRLARLDCGLLAIEAGVTEGSGERLPDLIARFACDILIVR